MASIVFFYNEVTMDTITYNNLIRFKDISKKKEGIFANFRIKGVNKGVIFQASISVNLEHADVNPADSLETIIEACAKVGLVELRNAEFQFEGLTSL